VFAGHQRVISDIKQSGTLVSEATMTAAYRIVMVRHGESVWNAENRFCGWYDADLAPSGVEEAKRAAEVGLSRTVYIVVDTL